LEDHPEEVELEKPMKIYLQCPFAEKWTDKKNKQKIPKVPFVTIHLERRKNLETLYPAVCPDHATPEVKLVYMLGLEGLLNAYFLELKLDSCPADALDENGNWQPFRCKKVPYDKCSRMGVRASKTNPDKKEYVFGGDLIMATTYLVLIGLEMPCAVTVQYGNSNEHESGKTLGEQMKDAWEMGHLGEMMKVCIKDAGWDCESDYQYFYQENVATITGINRRGRVHDEVINGHEIDTATRIPKAPCGIKMTPNGVEKERGRICYVCNKACLKRVQPIDPECPHLTSDNRWGHSAHFRIADDLSVFSYVPRGSATEKEIKKYRSGSERMNSFTERVASKRCTLHSGKSMKCWAILKAIAIMLIKVFYFLQRINKELKELYLQGKSWEGLLVTDLSEISGRIMRFLL
jgi:hypothetical protein